MRTASWFAFVSLAALPAQLSAQQHLSNGDFSLGTLGWSESGPGCNQGVKVAQVVAGSSNNAFCLRPGATTFNPPHPPLRLCQNVSLVRGECYRFDVDAALFVTQANSQGGRVQVRIGTTLVGDFTPWNGSVAVGTYREHFTSSFQWGGTTGSHTLCVDMSRDRFICTTTTPELCIDNVSLLGSNLINNGDFSGATIAPWSGSGPGGNPTVALIDATGCGPDKAFCVRAGGNTFAPPHAPYVLRQQVWLNNGRTYQFDSDVSLHTQSGNSQGGTFGLRVGGTLFSTFTRWNGSVSANVTERDHMTVLFTWTGTTGAHPLDVELRRDRFIHSSTTPTLCVDNIRLRCVPTEIAATSLNGERKVLTPVTIRVRGTANSSFVTLVSGGELNYPFPIPPFGSLQIADPFVTAGAGALDASGNGSFSFVAPPFAIMMAPAFQTINIRGLNLKLGNSLRVCFY